jgi:hypothetical protein
MTTEPSRPLLVTGLPRSGTTWLARELARTPGAALPGREPMNPRAKQFALAGTLHAWTRLADDATARQRRTLRRVYRGHEPRVYSRYGVRQWAAPLPGSRLVVKDPFALLSLPLTAHETGTRPIVLFRHPGALLASYRRMGWSPAVDEIRRLRLPGAGEPAGDDDVAAMSWFWSTCYRTVLGDLAAVPGALVVDHAELTRGGEGALRQLLATCGWPADLGPAARRSPGGSRHAGGPVLHNFARTADDVTESWRAAMPEADAARVGELTADTWSSLRGHRVRFESTAPVEQPTGRTP